VKIFDEMDFDKNICLTNGISIKCCIFAFLNKHIITEEKMKDLTVKDEGAPVKFKYLLESEQDIRWGLTITTAGFESVAAGMDYPLKNHPARYLFTTEKGRILDEYQIIYVIGGRGHFESQSSKSAIVNVGDAFMLFPGEWHNYSCDKKTGWEAYCIGFRGVNIDSRCSYGFFCPQNPVFRVGIHESMVRLFREVVKTAYEQQAGFQQILAGCVNHLLGIIYASEKQSYTEPDIAKNIRQAQIVMQEYFTSDITPEAIAEMVNMSYALFRKAFKQYTGFAPHQYLMELKIRKIKELLVATQLPVKEIAFMAGFENADHCSKFFKNRTDMTMREFRDFAHGKK
jgi:AraC-like DNA-binding protein